ncbi:MAG TPA: FAD-dependent oxidoreductase [Gemmatimonadales bacterium]|nr:FAD-dependent oxidoreductase [Gemmatimonadales bacterium]
MNHLVLLGGGEAHLFVLDAIRRGRLRGADVTLIAPPTPEPWPPMLAGIVAGRYRLEESLPDIGQLAGAAGVRRVTGSPEGIDAAGRTIRVAGADPVSWDILSIATRPEPASGPAAALPGRPASKAAEIPARLEALTGDANALSVVVVGGGIRGLELACAVRRRLGAMNRGFGDRVTLVERGPQVLPMFSPGASRAAERVLLRQRVGIATGTTAVGGGNGTLQFDHGGSTRADLVIWAGERTAPSWLQTSGLEIDARGFAETDAGLRSVSHPSVFASGGAGRIQEGGAADRRTRPARRDATALLRGIAAALKGDFTSVHRPTRPVATFVDTSDGRALVFGKNLAVHSTAALYLKERRDRELIQRLRTT